MNSPRVASHAFSAGCLHVIPVLSDNYSYILEWEGRCAIVDPGQAAPVLDFLSGRSLRVECILLTHGHHDHVGGISEIQRAYSTPIVAPTGCRLAQPFREIRDGDVLPAGPFSLMAMSTPGHTAHDTSYYSPAQGVLLCGDTLFGGGCGRLLECPPEIMWASLQRLAALPGSTLVCCGHEYTLSNLQFALQQLGSHPAIKSRLERSMRLRDQGRPTIPSTVELENQTNIFLLAAQPEIRKRLGMEGASPLDVFRELRERKNRA